MLALQGLKVCENRTRRRWVYALGVCGVVPLGLATRRLPWLPEFLKDHGGDALWAAMVYFGLAFCFPRQSVLRIAGYAAVFSLFIECSQLIQHPWLVATRQSPIGGLVLGHGFLWVDLVRYAAGVSLGAAIDRYAKKLDVSRQGTTDCPGRASGNNSRSETS